MSEQNKDRVRRGYQTIAEGMRRGNLDALDEFVAENVQDHNPDPGQAAGRQGIKQWFLTLGRGFPDMDIQIQDMLAEGDKVVSRLRFSGTHSGEFQGMPATNKRISVDVIDFLRLENGNVVERWGLSDQIGMMHQLGMTEQTAQA